MVLLSAFSEGRKMHINFMRHAVSLLATRLVQGAVPLKPLSNPCDEQQKRHNAYVVC